MQGIQLTKTFKALTEEPPANSEAGTQTGAEDRLVNGPEHPLVEKSPLPTIQEKAKNSPYNSVKFRMSESIYTG
jgi:hypothetical protein